MIGKILLKQYQIKELIHQGTQSKIYKASDLERGVDVAIKLFAIDNTIGEAEVERFSQGINILKALKHPNIVRVFQDFQTDGQIGIVMEYVEGKTLRARLEHEGVLDLGIVIQLIRQIGAALKYAHHQGIIHRNIKPESILIGGGNISKLTGFGRARFVDAASLTKSITIEINKPQYLAPEQYLGKRANKSTDLYCLGLIFYEMLVGELPVATSMDASQFELFDSIFSQKLRSVSIPINIRRVMLKSLRTDPNKRYKSLEEFLDKLEGATAPYLTSAQIIPKDTSERFYEAVKDKKQYLGEILEAFGIGVFTSALAFLIGNYSQPALAVIGSVIAMTVGLVIRLKGYPSRWAWLAGVGTGTLTTVLGMVLFSATSAISGTGTQANFGDSTVSLPTATLEKPYQKIIPLTSIPSSTPDPTSIEVPTEAASPLFETPSNVSSTEVILTEIGTVETIHCTECGIQLELTVIDENFMPLKDAIVYFKQKDTPTTFDPKYTDNNGRIQNIQFKSQSLLELILSHIIVEKGSPNARIIPGDGTVISASPGNIVHATLKLEKLPLEDVFLLQVGKVEVDYECINTSNMISFNLRVVNEDSQPLPGVIVHFYQKGDPLNEESAKIFGETDPNGRTLFLFSTQYSPEFWLSHIVINPGGPNERIIFGDGTIVTANKCDIVHATLKLAHRPSK